MSFRLSNILANFQNYINKILAEKLNIFVIVYMNNILIYSKNPNQEYIEGVRWGYFERKGPVCQFKEVPVL